MLIADGHLGIWGAARAVFPTVGEQRCWNHRIVSVLDALPKKLQAGARELLTKIPYAETRAEAEQQKRQFQAWATKKGAATAARRLDEDWERLVTFLDVPERALDAPAYDERSGVAVRRGPAADGRGEAVQEGGERDGGHLEELLVAEQSFRRLNAPELLPEVAEGVVYVDGMRGQAGQQEGRLIFMCTLDHRQDNH